MDSDKRFHYKSLLLPVAFVIFLVLTFVFWKQAFSQDKEALGTDVHVRVTEVKTKSSGINPGALRVTVSYQGEEYRLHGVPSGAHFVMENSKRYRSTVGAKLYEGKMYYDSASIHLLADKIYYACLAGTLLIFSLMFMQLKERLQG